jgi:hypothetical protein
MSDIVNNSNPRDNNKLKGSENTPENSTENNHDHKVVKNKSKQRPPPTSSSPLLLSESNDEIFSSQKHSMDYVTVQGVILRTGYHNKRDWYLLCIKELLDNAVDFLWKRYQGASDAAIDVRIEKTSGSLFRIKIRNTNNKNFEVPLQGQNLKAILDYAMRYGSKQNLHIISRGVLGDAMKQILALPYVLIHANDDGTAFTDRQWEHPLIIRCNRRERQVFLHVDKANQHILAKPIIESDKELPYTDTEIEVTLPIVDEVADSLDIHDVIERFCKEYPIFTTDISFKFRLVDYSPDKETSSSSEQQEQQEQQQPQKSLSSLSNTDKNKVATELVKALSSPARKAPIKIDYPALHPISKTWVNIASIGSYKPTEFMTFIEGVYDKDNTTLDQRLRQLAEGTQMRKNPDNDISIAQIIADPTNKSKKIEQLYFELQQVLKHILDPSKKLSLPYTTNTGKRKDALVKRIARLYDNKLDTKRAVYKLEYGRYTDNEYGHLNFPYAFEIIAIPYDHDTIEKARQEEEPVKSEFKGSVNYSISPRGNMFEGNYKWDDKKSDEFYAPSARDIKGILEVYEFHFYVRANSKVKLPCVIFANLVSQRIDYHGHDKARIDTEPFKSAIITAARKLVDDIPTYRAAGWKFEKEKRIGGRGFKWRSYYTPVKEKKTSIREHFRKFLVEKRGLPDVK